MPTPDMAVQMAAWEPIARLRHLAAGMHRRAFHFYPSCATFGGDTVFTSAHQEEDLAVVHLTRYIVAQENLFSQLVDELAMTRRALTLLSTQNPSRSPSVTSTPVTISEAQPLPGIPIVANGGVRRSTPTTDYLQLFSTYTETARAEHRRQNPTTPNNTPTSSEDRNIHDEVVLTQPAAPDVNRAV